LFTVQWSFLINCSGLARPGGYCVTLVYPIPLLPSGPGGVFRLQLRSPPGLLKRGRPRTSWRLPWIAHAVKLVPRLKRREWDSNPRWSHPHTRFPSVLLKPLGHLSGGEHFSASKLRLYHRSLVADDLDWPDNAVLKDRSKISHELFIVNLAKTGRVFGELGNRLG
jgi:hypothetical protein